MSRRTKLLFVCSQNRIRSLTAESLFAGSTGYEARSVGTEADARVRITEGHIGWADIIFVMEPRHRDRLRHRYRDLLQEKKLVCLYIRDEYEPMADDLKAILRSRIAGHLPPSSDDAA